MQIEERYGQTVVTVEGRVWYLYQQLTTYGFPVYCFLTTAPDKLLPLNDSYQIAQLPEQYVIDPNNTKPGLVLRRK